MLFLNIKRIKNQKKTNNNIGDYMNINYEELWIVIYRSFLSLATLFLVTKVLGKKQVSQLSLFDYVIGISIGNFAAEMTINLESQTMNGILAVFIFGIVAYVVSILTMKSIFLRRFFISTPTVLIEKGQIMKEGLKKVKYDINDLLQQCRINGYFDVSDIEYALMEPNGSISILPKESKRLVNLEDLKIKSNQSGLCANVIIDGKIMETNLSNINKTKTWLLKQLKTDDLSNILLATIDNEGNLKVYHNNDKRHAKEILE